MTFECKFCHRQFSKESTLTSHVCEQKRRHQQEKEIGVQWGLQAYLLFYNSTQSAGKTKSYDDFSTSAYYLAFVKFGRYCVNVRCINFLSFTHWLLKNNKKLDCWASDQLYEEWLMDYLRKESVEDAMERGLNQMQEYALENSDLKNGYLDYFRYGSANRIIHHVATGRVSAWIIYNCASGVEFLESLDEDQIRIILPWIDPDYWQLKFKNSREDVDWVKNILFNAGL